MIGLFRVLFYIILGYIIFQIYRFFISLSRSARIKKPPTQKKQISGVMVKDETCNTYLPKEESIKKIYQGKEYYFCSQECLKKFLEKKKSE
jgi:YHS domain-containing protein